MQLAMETFIKDIVTYDHPMIASFGDNGVLSAAAKRGADLFFSADMRARLSRR